MATYNTVSFQNKLNNFATNSKMVKEKMYIKAADKFEDARNEMLKEYEDTKVVQELRYGGLSNDSALISEGNLFAFLGFDKSDSPATDLKEFLKDNITMAKTPRITPQNNVIKFAYRVNIPSEQKIYSDPGLKATWSTKSWVDYVQNGLGNAAQFIFKSIGFASPPSRSGTGLQLKKGERKDAPTFTPMKFLNELLDDFKEKFKR